MIKGRDFIFTGMQPWDITIGSNARDIAIEVSKHNRVLYVNTPLDVLTYYKGENLPESEIRKNIVSKGTQFIRKINDNLWILDYPFAILPVNFLPDGILFDMVNRINNRRMYKFVMDVVESLGFSDYILFTDNDIYRSFYASGYLKPTTSVYYRRDRLISAYWKNHAPRLEPLLCQKSDIVLTNSDYLAKGVAEFNQNTFSIGQGIDLSSYDYMRDYPVPEDMRSIPGPVIGYAGYIFNLRLDVDLIYQLSIMRPDYSFVMVGKECEEFKEHKIHTQPNVYFIGEKHVSEIPAYISCFDVCINPQRLNEVTVGNYPRKIDEYLALGKPVVATSTGAMLLFEDYVWCCSNAEQFINDIDEALKAQSAKDKIRRVEFAHSHSWTNSVEKMYSIIEAKEKRDASKSGL